MEEDNSEQNKEGVLCEGKRKRCEEICEETDDSSSDGSATHFMESYVIKKQRRSAEHVAVKPTLIPVGCDKTDNMTKCIVCNSFVSEEGAMGRCTACCHRDDDVVSQEFVFVCNLPDNSQSQQIDSDNDEKVVVISDEDSNSHEVINLSSDDDAVVSSDILTKILQIFPPKDDREATAIKIEGKNKKKAKSERRKSNRVKKKTVKNTGRSSTPNSPVLLSPTMVAIPSSDSVVSDSYTDENSVVFNSQLLETTDSDQTKSDISDRTKSDISGHEISSPNTTYSDNQQVTSPENTDLRISVQDIPLESTETSVLVNSADSDITLLDLPVIDRLEKNSKTVSVNPLKDSNKHDFAFLEASVNNTTTSEEEKNISSTCVPTSISRVPTLDMHNVTTGMQETSDAIVQIHEDFEICDAEVSLPADIPIIHPSVQFRKHVMDDLNKEQQPLTTPNNFQEYSQKTDDFSAIVGDSILVEECHGYSSVSIQENNKQTKCSLVEESSFCSLLQETQSTFIPKETDNSSSANGDRQDKNMLKETSVEVTIVKDNQLTQQCEFTSKILDKETISQTKFTDLSVKTSSVENSTTKLSLISDKNYESQHTNARSPDLSFLQQTSAAKKCPLEKVPSNEIHSKKTLTEEITSDEILTENVPSDEIHSKITLTEEIPSDEILTEKVLSDEIPLKIILTEEISSDEALARKVPSHEILSNIILTKEISPDEMLAKKFPSDEIPLKRTLTEEITSDEIPEERYLSNQIHAEEVLAEKIPTKKSKKSNNNKNHSKMQMSMGSVLDILSSNTISLMPHQTESIHSSTMDENPTLENEILITEVPASSQRMEIAKAEKELETKEPETRRTSYEFLKSADGPKLMAMCRKEFRSSCENYLRGCWWSPDGQILLTNSDDNILRLFQIPEVHQECLSEGKLSQNEEMKPVVRMSEGETIYDTCWYPYMNSNDTDTCCFLTTSRDHPVHLWDSMTGRVRCSYRAFDQMDELSSAHSISFNSDGSQIYCGFNKCIRIFDSSRPGRQFTEKSTVPKKNRSRKERSLRSLNQNGIISSIAFSNSYCGLYALGSFQKTVGLYASNDDEPICLLREHEGGITDLKFTTDGFYLFSGARKDSEIICWDMRNTTIPLFKVRRDVTTNQRIQFDMDSSSTYLFSGSTSHVINVWNIRDIMSAVGEEVVTHEPDYSYHAHQDAVNGVGLHPSGKLLASTSGQRHFIINDVSDTDDETSNEQVEFRTDISYDNSLKLWRL